MTLETGLILSTCALLAIALMTQALGLSGAFERRRWRRLIVVMRVAAAAALTAALTLVAINEGAWTPFELRHLTLGIALAALTIQLAMAWGCHTDGAGPVLDLVVLGLSLLAVEVRTRDALPTCPQREILFLAQWGLFVVGTGGAVVAGSAGLMLLLRGFLAKIGWDPQLPPGDDVQTFLRQATMLTLAALGIGLVVGSWLAWSYVGTPTGGDPRSTWMAITWLISAMSLLAWRLRQRPGRQGLWAAILDISAASTAIVGILAITGIGRVLGM
jgi:hypothetical protein